MTIDEIKQAMREIKERCANIEYCDNCPFSIVEGRENVCPMIVRTGACTYPYEWEVTHWMPLPEPPSEKG